jgi:hypothetical protein
MMVLMAKRWAVAVAMASCAVVLSACVAGSPPPAEPEGPAEPSPAAACSLGDVPPPEPDAEFDQQLHDELIAMLERDQAERTGTAVEEEGDGARTARLEQIILEHGWPTVPLVGEDGEDAAWAIAQHSDQHPDFQCAALEVLRDAVDAGLASAGNLAYLEDRVLVSAGEPQLYGTQIGCGTDGPSPTTPIADEATVDERRAAAGLAPLADYYAELAAICAADGG